MTSVETPIAGELPPTGPAPDGSLSARPRNWIWQVFLDTFGRVGARVGLAWIVFIALCAVFAPFLANSYPIVAKMNGQWSSPMLKHLTSTDVILLVTFFAAIACFFVRRWLSGLTIYAFLIVFMFTWGLAVLLVQPPGVDEYDQYRRAQAEGKVEYILYTLVPFSPSDRLLDEFDLANPPPNTVTPRHWMGTEQKGQDVLSGMIHASRSALAVGFVSTGIALVIGAVIGGLMGYFSGIVDLLGMRLVEIFSAIPTLFLVLTCVAFFGRDIYIIMAIIGFTGWTGDARFVRAEFLRLRQQDFVQAARACALPLRSILFRHLLPNGMAPLLVSASFGIASAIFVEATLSFLGLGLVDQPSWGALLNQAVSNTGGFYWWLCTFPGFAIFLTVFAYVLIGESMRDAVDPRSRHEG